MKFLILTALAGVFSLSTYAVTLNIGEIKLDFDHSYNYNKIKSFEPTELKIMAEKVSFPQGEQKIKLFKAMKLLKLIMNSEEFKKMVITYKRPSNGKRQYSKNYLWKNSKALMSNEDIYALIMEGDEKMIPNTVSEMNLNVKKYRSPWWNYKGKRVVGYTNPGSDKTIYVNWRFYYKFEIPSIVANLTHEWLHLLGFLHGKNAPGEEVPYVVGRIAGKLAEEYIQKNPAFIN